ncbi:MAG: hypothetical protein ACJ735_16935 [Actinomycetes bacterium]
MSSEANGLESSGKLLALAEAADLPPLERLRFAALFADGLDEFFMLGDAVRRPRSDVRLHHLVRRYARVLVDDIVPTLAAHGINLLPYAELAEDERRMLSETFVAQIRPILTPLAVDPTHPFPFVSALSLNLAVVVGHQASERERFARVKVPPVLPRYVRAGTARFVLLEDLIRAHLPGIFSGLEVREAHAFRVTRAVEKGADPGFMRRNFGSVTRLEVESGMSDRVVELLLRALGSGTHALYRLSCALDLGTLWSFVDAREASGAA